MAPIEKRKNKLEPYDVPRAKLWRNTIDSSATFSKAIVCDTRPDLFFMVTKALCMRGFGKGHQ